MWCPAVRAYTGVRYSGLLACVCECVRKGSLHDFTLLVACQHTARLSPSDFDPFISNVVSSYACIHRCEVQRLACVCVCGGGSQMELVARLHPARCPPTHSPFLTK